MKRILFVDDEPRVLEGLRRMLRSLRREWDMEFVESGPEALGRLATSPVDVLVTDVRMPGMDGTQLLRQVLEKYPSAVRIILSGQCERGAVLECVGPAHQFLTKPCDSETLTSTVARACRLRDHLPDEWIKQAVSCVQALPCRPSAYTELTTELARVEASVQHVGQTISREPGMTAKILQLVSSGFFGTPQRVSDVVHAVELLGLETARELVESTDVLFPLDREDSQEGFWDVFGDHCMSVATAAREIAETETDDSRLICDAYLSGVLHDIGVLVFARDSTEHYQEILHFTRFDQITLTAAEKMTFNTSRDDVGAYLMGLWGLPDPIVRAIAYHLFPSRSADETFGPLAAVHVANAVVEEDAADVFGVPSPIDMDFLSRIGCADRLDTWREICRSTRSVGAPL